jgi:hypothetical protein
MPKRLDRNAPYAWIDFLEQHVPRGLPKGKRLIYVGIGSDIWLPFGVFGATAVTAYDWIDPTIVPVGATAKERLYGYATVLRRNLLELPATQISASFDEAAASFDLRFRWRGRSRRLTLVIGDVQDVARFPRADGILVGAPVRAGTRRRMIADSGAEFVVEWGQHEHEQTHLVYPASLQQFGDLWLDLARLGRELSPRCRAAVWRALDKADWIAGEWVAIKRV